MTAPPELALALASMFAPLGGVRGLAPRSGGTYNQVLEGTVGDGREVIVKISPPRSSPALSYEADLLHTEADYFAAACATPGALPVPRSWPWPRTVYRNRTSSS